MAFSSSIKSGFHAQRPCHECGRTDRRIHADEHQQFYGREGNLRAGAAFRRPHAGGARCRAGSFLQQFKIEGCDRWDVAVKTPRVTEMYTFGDGHVAKPEWTIRTTGEGRLKAANLA